MNQLEDPDLIQALCDASEAGVSIDLIVRGFCCLRPGVAGLTENIRVRSIIGRFLEHSRIFYFANGQESPTAGDFLIGSADWMHRNLSKRIEVVAPVLATGAKGRLWEILDICLRDQRQAWILGQDGKYSQLQPDGNTRKSPAAWHAPGSDGLDASLHGRLRKASAICPTLWWSKVSSDGAGLLPVRSFHSLNFNVPLTCV